MTIKSITLANALENKEIFVSGSTWLLDYLTFTPDFPKKGVTFISYEKLLENPKALKKTIQAFSDRYEHQQIDTIVGLDSRGFIFGPLIAYELGKPFVMIRKEGKLPHRVEKVHYELEYGRNTFEIAVDSFKEGNHVLIIDDLLATGGTLQAANQLVGRLGGHVHEAACLVEIGDLKGRQQVNSPCFSLISINNL